MRWIGTRSIVTMAAVLASAIARAALLDADFSQGALPEGWECRSVACHIRPGAGIELKEDPHWNERMPRGYLQSPAIQIKPFHYAALDFSYRGKFPGYWVVSYFDEQGKELVVDNYDRIDRSSGWRTNRFVFRGHAMATQFRLRFLPDGQAMTLGKVTVTDADPAAVVAWADSIAATFPPVAEPLPATRGDLIPRTMRILREGGRLRIVMLGDSICSDIANSLFEAPLMRLYPKATIEVVSSIRASTGCAYYKSKNRVQEFALRFEPDLVIIAGISHGYDAESIRSVIRQIREKSDCDLLVLSGAICPEATCRAGFLYRNPLSRAEADAQMDRFPETLRAMAADERAGFLDMRGVWDRYMQASARPSDWFQRDQIHANYRGKQVAGRMLVRFFEPL